MTAIVDYDTGNLRSVADAMRRIGAEFTITAYPALLRGADRVLLPGVGEASSAMAKLRERGLDLVIPTLTQPVLGICIGMQLLCLDSEEGDARCLGIFPAHVRRLKPAENGLKIPHVGWNTVGGLRGTLLEGIDEETYVYYVHSYAAEVCEATIARTDYGGEFSAALGRGNFFGTQFHPEKIILKKFFRICPITVKQHRKQYSEIHSNIKISISTMTILFCAFSHKHSYFFINLNILCICCFAHFLDFLFIKDLKKSFLHNVFLTLFFRSAFL